MSSLDDKLALLRAKRETAVAKELPKDCAVFLGTSADKEYLPYLKGMFAGVPTYVCLEPLEMLSHLEMYCKSKGINKVVSTNVKILAKLLKWEASRKLPALSNYAGSFFKHGDLDIVFVDPLAQLLTVTYGKLLTSRYISKLVDKKSWRESTKFNWQLLETSNVEKIYAQFHKAEAIAVDIETFKRNLAIRCCGYTAVFIDSNTGAISTVSVVLPLDSQWALAWMRKFNSLPAAKILQNGKYDCSYLLRYNAPLENYMWDTATAMHCLYSELPKDLAFQNAFFLREAVYWKDLAETNDLFEYYRYNALDTWATANIWVTWMLEAPAYARRNYELEFPLIFPCLLAEMTGIKRDMEKLVEARLETDVEYNNTLRSLRACIGVPTFNPGSPVQVKQLLAVLGCGDLDSSDEKSLSKAKLRHPLNAFILEKILVCRGLRKLATTYLRLDSDAKQSGIHEGEGGGKEFCGRILYALNPHGTDTGRLASREHHFWTGLQIQNITRGPEVKQTICSDEGFYLGECDLEQAESRDTAHIAGEVNLIAAVTSTRDFHSVNASAFFGRSYESIFDDSIGKTKDKKLRDLAKRVNHGANYNMGAGVLVDTMGLDKIWEAGRLLKLPFVDPKKIAEYLLETFHRTYPAIQKAYYVSVKQEVATTSMLVSRAYHHTEYNKRTYSVGEYIKQGDWTRYTFGNPNKSKRDLNAYVAHCPQSLNARTLNEAFLKVFYEIALPNPQCFRLHAQIHDSILFSYKHGREDLADKVRECMEIPVTVHDVSGINRIFTVPAALKLGKTDKATGKFIPATYWSETE